MTVMRMDGVGIVVGDFERAIRFFAELGLQLEGKATLGGPVVDRHVGLDQLG